MVPSSTPTPGPCRRPEYKKIKKKNKNNLIKRKK
jgi:hypothetical protein